jgi:hypothetical protein
VEHLCSCWAEKGELKFVLSHPFARRNRAKGWGTDGFLFKRSEALRDFAGLAMVVIMG